MGQRQYVTGRRFVRYAFISFRVYILLHSVKNSDTKKKYFTICID